MIFPNIKFYAGTSDFHYIPLEIIPREKFLDVQKVSCITQFVVCGQADLLLNVLRATTGALTSYVVRSPLYVQYAWMWQCSCSPSELQGVAVLSQLSPEKPSRQDPLRHTPPLPGRLSHTPWTQWHSENTHTLYKIEKFSLNDIIVARFGFYEGCKHKRCNRLKQLMLTENPDLAGYICFYRHCLKTRIWVEDAWLSFCWKPVQQR